MPSRTLLNIAILIAVAVLAIIAFYPGVITKAPTDNIRLFAIRKTDIQKLGITASNKSEIRFSKQAGQWLMSTPVVARASQHRIDALLNILEQPSRNQYVVDKDDLAKYGLDEPLYIIAFNEHALSVGSIDPIHQRRYVFADNKVHLIDDFFSHLLTEGAAKLIDHALLPPDSQIEKLILPEYQLYLQQGQWQVSGFTESDNDNSGNGDIIRNYKNDNNEKKYSQDALQTLIDEWRFGRALQISIQSEPYVPTTAPPRVQVYLKNQAHPIVFHVNNTSGQMLLIRPKLKLRYHITANTAQRLLHIPDMEAAE